jgi:6,7-dimethyl-8-ribityllumazine synthase
MPQEWSGELSAAGLRLALVVSRFTSEITDRLLAGALEAIDRAGGDVRTLPVARVPGSLELAVVARKFAESGYDAVICLGCVIRGETAHYDCVVQGTTQSIAAVAAETGVPVIFGVLTCDDYEQALNRSDASRKMNMGVYAAQAGIEMANLMKKVASRKSKVKGRVRGTGR